MGATNNRVVKVIVTENNEQGEVTSITFESDELTFSEQKAILFLKSIEKDAFDVES